MKQIFLITIVVLLLLSGCSNTSNNSHNNKNTSVTNEQGETAQSEKYLITGELIPASYTIKTLEKDYALKIRPLSDKAVFKVTTETMVDIKNPTNNYPNALRKLEILDNGMIVFQKIFNGTYFDILWVDLMDFKVFSGTNEDYFAYSIDSTMGSAEHSSSYRAIKIIQNKDKYNIVKLKGVLPMQKWQLASNDNIVHTINLYDNKYIKVIFWDGYDAIESEFEFTDTTIQETQKEFRLINIENINNNTNIIKNDISIVLYTNYMLDKVFKSIKLSEKSKIQILGGRHYKNLLGEDDKEDIVIPYFYGSSIHVIIDGDEGWISNSDYRELGLN